jgi:putative ABC transport system ATP-binding protein
MGVSAAVATELLAASVKDSIAAVQQLPKADITPYSGEWIFKREDWMKDMVLSFRDVELTLQGNAGPVNILRSITLDVTRGETVGLIGPSGSGKSSLLMLMGGLERATSGAVSALGHDLTALGEDALARFRREHMGVVFQSFHLIPTMTALENVATPLELAGRRDAFDRAEEELRTVGLGHRLDHYPAQMSGGEQQRVALARAAAPRPDILLADEPTGNLDGPNGQAIMDLLFGLRDRHGATLVLVTHAPELAARCDRVVTLADGRISGVETHRKEAAE